MRFKQHHCVWHYWMQLLCWLLDVMLIQTYVFSIFFSFFKKNLNNFFFIHNRHVCYHCGRQNTLNCSVHGRSKVKQPLNNNTNKTSNQHSSPIIRFDVGRSHVGAAYGRSALTPHCAIVVGWRRRRKQHWTRRRYVPHQTHVHCHCQTLLSFSNVLVTFTLIHVR